MEAEEGAVPRRAVDRRGTLSAMEADVLDLVVVGGGITGCGVARDAALRGLSVALLEKEDFGAGTSGRSSKIIHGGVRYLEQCKFRLVRESARERTILQAIAPHLVHRIAFHYPVFGGESFWKIRVGLGVFDLLAGSRRGERATAVDAAETRKALPGLRDPLKGAVRYPEFITDDARFTLENALSAAAHGALVANHVQVEELVRTYDGRISGVVARDALDGSTIHVRARAVVNATGPWAQEFLEGTGLRITKPLVPSKGIHILVPAHRLPLRGASFLRARNGKSGLVMRRGEWVYVGTTDDTYHGSMDRVRAQPPEVEELLALTRDSFPDAGISWDDVRATWGGIRPLIQEEGKSTRDMSREDQVWIGPPGLVTVAGGKLTTYRRMAERILEAVGTTMGQSLPEGGAAARTPLPGSPLTTAHRLDGPEGEADEPMLRSLARMEVEARTRERLGWLYGRQLGTLAEFGREDPKWLDPLGPEVPALRGEVRLAVEEEMALTLTDFMDRRSALLLFGENHGLAAAEEASRIMASILGWSSERRRQELSTYRALAKEHDVPRE